MTEFITRSCKAESRYEVIVKTDSEEHYKATEDFARRLIGHAKPNTNADHIRAMSDDELANELSLVAGWDRKQYRRAKSIGINKVMLEWLRQPVGEKQHEID